MRTLLLTTVAGLALATTLHAQGTEHMQSRTRGASALHWGPAPPVFPKGARMAVVSGDPGKAGVFTIQLAMPDGYRIPPHFHPTDESVVVRRGTFLVGMGDTLDLAKTRTMTRGQSGTIPAGKHHYAAAKGSVVVAVTARGPFAMTYVNRADDPQHAHR